MTDLGPQPGRPQAPYPAEKGSARRRYLTMVFSDLAGSTRIAGAMEAEEYAHLLEGLRQAYQAVIPQFGGTMVQISGDGLLAVFGYPETNEGDGRAATMAALELHARVRALDGPAGSDHALRLHTGIHSGLVLVNEGDTVRGRLELLGSATNIASRLATAAQSDEIVVSEATLGPDRCMFQTGEREFLSLKGKDKPIAAFRVLGLAPDGTRYAARERRALSPFVGRQEPLLRLRGAVEHVTAGRAAFVSVAGPPGVGKTRLVTELLARDGAGLQVYRGECDSHLGAEPLQPFLQILRSVLAVPRSPSGGASAEGVQDPLGALDPALTRHGAVLRHLLLPSREEAGTRRPDAASVAAALRALFMQMAGEKPLALFIDDWQWADDASHKVLEGLRGLETVPVLVLLTMRSGPDETAGALLDNFERLELAPLSDEETKSAVGQVLPGVDPFLVDNICAASGGNPLFIEELCHSAAYGERDFRTHDGSGWLDILIESRFARLPDAQAGVLATAAVIGNVIPAWLLEQTSGCGEDDPLVRALGDGDFIFPGEREGTLRFKHGITRDVIYDSVGLRERRALHIRIAEALRRNGAAIGEEDVEALAYHYGAGGDDAATADYALSAGNKALAAAALDRAQRQYRAALDALDRLPQSEENSRRWDKVARRFGLACVFDPATAQLPVFERAVEHAAVRGDGTALALAEYWLGYIHLALGHASETIPHCERALAAALSVGDQNLALQIKALLGQAYMMTGDYGRALALLDEAIAVMRRYLDQLPELSGFAYSLSSKGFVLADLGRFGEARDHFEEALRVIEGAEHPVEASVLSQYEAALLWQGRMEEAARISADGKRVSARVRTFYLYARSQAAGAYARWALTGHPDAVRQLEEATTWLQRSERVGFMSLNHGWLAEMLAAADPATARHHAARAISLARSADRLGEAMACRAIARLAEAQGQPARADHFLARAAAAALSRGSRHEAAKNRLCAAELALGRGDRDSALAALDDAEAEFAAMDMGWHAERAARLREAGLA